VRRELNLGATVVESKNIYDLTGLNGEDVAHLIRQEENADRERPDVLLDVGDVAVWRFPTFSTPLSEIRNRMKVVRAHRALVLDLRGNQGGLESALLTLMGQLSPEDDTLGVDQERRRRTPLVAKGDRDNAFAGPLVVLVDSRSASASEILARVVQLTRRGVVLGDRTAGAVMRSEWYSYGIGAETIVFYGVAVTTADVVMSDGGRLEGVGVQPDTLILPTGADLAARRDPVLARALAILGKPMDPAAAGSLMSRPE
jgi:carboxyl-terminal processing protease